MRKPNQKRDDHDTPRQHAMRELLRAILRAEPDHGMLKVTPNPRLGLLILDHERIHESNDGRAVGMVDVIEKRAVLDGNEAYDRLATYLGQAGVEVERREEGRS